jgi:membrane-bound lytic murein transglycosylase B
MTTRFAAAGLTLALGTLLAACASAPPAPATPATPATPAVAASPATSSAAQPATGAAQTEKHTAETLEKKFQEAARGYKVVQRDGKTLYCKRERVIGSSIPTMQCLTEAQLRTQVETMEELRERMRHSGKCTLGPGCKGG